MRNFKNFVFASLVLGLGLVATSCKKDDAAPEVPAPAITTLSAITGCETEVITINGTNFGATASENIVKFGTVTATISQASATQLTVTIPTRVDGVNSVSVTVATRSKTSNGIGFTYNNKCKILE